MLDGYLPLFIVLTLAVGLGAAILLLSAWMGPRRPSSVKMESFECGNPTSGSARDRINVKFYLVAILFLVFDIEAVFIYPWAVVFSDSAKGLSTISPAFVVAEMGIFVAVILVGLAYAWRKGALDWNPGS